MIHLKTLLVESEDDGYYYHVTLAPYANRIKQQGLVSNRKPTVSNYSSYSKNKIFFCDRSNLNWWTNKIGEHAFHQFDDDKFHSVAIFRISKDKLQNAHVDNVGTKDSGVGCYFVTYDVPPDVLEFVGIQDDPY